MIENTLTFLQAKRLVKEATFTTKQDIKIFTSSNLDQLSIYLKAFAAKESIDLRIQTTPFNTLRQNLINKESHTGEGILILCPWDFIGSLDWRSGLPESFIDLKTARKEIDKFEEVVIKSNLMKIVYIDADIPPVTGLTEDLQMISSEIKLKAKHLGSKIIPNQLFSIDSFLASGSPFGGSSLNHAACIITVSYTHLTLPTKA